MLNSERLQTYDRFEPFDRKDITINHQHKATLLLIHARSDHTISRMVQFLPV